MEPRRSVWGAGCAYHSFSFTRGTFNLRLPAKIEEALYGVAREALNNVLKHAKASKVSVLLGPSETGVFLQVVDDGVGFDLATAGNRGGFGLIGMEERARKLGGHTVVRSRPEKGSLVRVDLPVPLDA